MILVLTGRSRHGFAYFVTLLIFFNIFRDTIDQNYGYILCKLVKIFLSSTIDVVPKIIIIVETSLS